MFGYRNIRWDRPSKNLWSSPNGKYKIQRHDAITFIVTHYEYNTEVGALIYRDHIIVTRLNNAKKWCDGLCEQDYLHNLQLDINETSRYSQ